MCPWNFNVIETASPEISQSVFSLGSVKQPWTQGPLSFTRKYFLKRRRRERGHAEQGYTSQCLICYADVHNFQFYSLGLKVIKCLWPEVVISAIPVHTHAFLDWFFFFFCTYFHFFRVKQLQRGKTQGLVDWLSSRISVSVKAEVRVISMLKWNDLSWSKKLEMICIYYSFWTCALVLTLCISFSVSTKMP